MKRFLAALVLAGCLIAMPGRSSAAPDVYDDSQSHPLRVAAYLVYPVAYAIEWIVFRPFHFLVSSYPEVFGHHPHAGKELES
jgi:hypothetical protein